MKQNKKQGFTLIELLVVVLIIGILSAVALPQYQKTVEKSKSAQAVTMLKSVYQAAEEYYLANGTWPTSFEKLSVSAPWTGTEKWYTSGDIRNAVSNQDWSLQIVQDSFLAGINIGRWSGKYKGGGFGIWRKYNYGNTMPLNTVICIEAVAHITNPGDYCQKVMQSGQLISAGPTLRYYKM